MFSHLYSNFTSNPVLEHYNIIIPHLYIGDIDSLKSSQLFTLIVNCTTHIPVTGKNPTIRIPIYDDPRETETLLDYMKNTIVLEQIHHYITKKNNVLVHCHAGMQRSCAVVGMYLMKYHRMTPEQVLQFIPTKRSIAFQPQPTFRKALEEFYAGLGEEKR